MIKEKPFVIDCYSHYYLILSRSFWRMKIFWVWKKEDFIRHNYVIGRRWKRNITSQKNIWICTENVLNTKFDIKNMNGKGNNSISYVDFLIVSSKWLCYVANLNKHKHNFDLYMLQYTRLKKIITIYLIAHTLCEEENVLSLSNHWFSWHSLNTLYIVDLITLCTFSL